MPYVVGRTILQRRTTHICDPEIAFSVRQPGVLGSCMLLALRVDDAAINQHPHQHLRRESMITTLMTHHISSVEYEVPCSSSTNCTITVHGEHSTSGKLMTSYESEQLSKPGCSKMTMAASPGRSCLFYLLGKPALSLRKAQFPSRLPAPVVTARGLRIKDSQGRERNIIPNPSAGTGAAQSEANQVRYEKGREAAGLNCAKCGTSSGKTSGDIDAKHKVPGRSPESSSIRAQHPNWALLASAAIFTMGVAWYSAENLLPTSGTAPMHLPSLHVQALPSSRARLLRVTSDARGVTSAITLEPEGGGAWRNDGTASVMEMETIGKGQAVL
ncbi:hypothetical protein K437DRAFT_29190 [Tilletiaria anomala UBC 951]|uniref:Uncharacterized protein n=1 Tax=Tilletiaria anomala (strain ATCC 24038 / CBS 436.72 / UBC 951) TaxID=1037660 RepID=A0A066V8R8_TILAU|nr:uncharacterized protein K437DRAFT_29190 [Tilletiaria anomala UBC 951]KDN38142.1 hypothetical protein K437DRAFT_29190 [Tilletiaria anomala UBC 951]